MSVVWRAHDEVLDREVAVKVLAVENAADAGLLERIRVEARAAARLRHPSPGKSHKSRSHMGRGSDKGKARAHGKG